MANFERLFGHELVQVFQEILGYKYAILWYLKIMFLSSNINYRPNFGPIIWCTFFGHSRFLQEDQETIIYRLGLILTQHFLFWFPTFGGKMGMATTCAPKSLGAPNPTRNMAYWRKSSSQLLSRNDVFENFRDETLDPLFLKT